MLTFDVHELKHLARSQKWEFVALFGSRARRTERSDSDVDIAVMPAADTQAPREDLIRQIGDALGRYDLDVVWLPTAGWLVSAETARDGKVLYETRNGCFEEFKHRTGRRYEDAIFWRRRSDEYVKRWLLGTSNMNVDLVRNKLQRLVQLLRDLDQLLATPERASGLNHYVGERLLGLLVEYAAEINTEVAQSVANIPPSDYDRSFFSMAHADWISAETATALSQCASGRNRLAHRYDDVSIPALYSALEASCPHWRSYALSVDTHLQKRS